ncbi:MAG: hypothetical protein ACE5GQ_10015, partial [Nitrospinales bacterium]
KVAPPSQSPCTPEINITQRGLGGFQEVRRHVKLKKTASPSLSLGRNTIMISNAFSGSPTPNNGIL